MKIQRVKKAESEKAESEKMQRNRSAERNLSREKGGINREGWYEAWILRKITEFHTGSFTVR